MVHSPQRADASCMATSPAVSPSLASHDPVWTRVRAEASAIMVSEPALSGLILSTVLGQPRLEDVVVRRIADRLGNTNVPAELIRLTYLEALADEPELGDIFRVDLTAVVDRDPVCERFIEPVMFFKGFHAIETHRLANWLWRHERRDFALYLQSRASEVFQTDIHPAVPMGRGIFLDHATGLVVGSTAAIGDDVSILQGVTLGGTGKEAGDRHPKIGRGVLIGAGAKILGNIAIGNCSRIAAGSVVLAAVPANTTVAGVPARVVGRAGCAEPARSMDQMLAATENVERAGAA